MVSRSLPDETRTELDNLLKQWSARWRLRQIVLFLPRIVIAMCASGLITGLVVTIFSLLAAAPMLILSALVMGATLLLMSGGIGFWSKSTEEYARQFDALFEAQERLATALELLSGRIQTGQELAERQLQDTYEFAREVDVRKQMPLKVRWMEWLAAMIVLILSLAVLGYAAFALARQANAMGQATQAAIESAAETTRDITTEIATDTDLSEEERSSLLESTETTLSELENPDNNAEDSYVAMSDLESDLREQAEAIQQGADSSNDAMQSAMDALDGEQEIPEENPGDALSEQLSEMMEETASLSQEEQDALAHALQEAADLLRETNEDLANQLEDAADAMQNGETQQAQDALNQASQQAQEAAQQNQARSETAEALQEAADQAQDAAQQIAESESQDAQEGQEAQDAQQSDEEGQQPQDGQDAQDGQQSQDAQQSQDGQQGQQSQDAQQSQDGQQGQQSQDSQQTQQGQSGDPVESGEDNSESEQGGGSGESESQGGTQDVSGDQNGVIETTAEGDGGETEYDPIFAPSTSNVEAGDTNIELQTDDSTSQTIEGDFQDNPDGVSSVPYNQVFSSYADAANTALENGYVPLGVRDIVRDYFTSIEPTGNQAGE